MSYLATWTNGDSQGRVEPAVHRVRQCDATELAAAINRRRLLTFQAADDFSGLTFDLAPIRRTLIQGADSEAFHDFRDNIENHLLTPPTDVSHPSMQWLWPVADGDENKVITTSSPGGGQVNLFAKLNGTSSWTDPSLVAGQSHVRAVHWNEIRQSVEWLTRGRWVLPLFFAGGLFSVLPDTPWFGGAIANNGASELRTVGLASLAGVGSPRNGLTAVTVRASSFVELTADTACNVEIRHCLRAVDCYNDPPSWNRYRPVAAQSWQTPGGTGSADSAVIGSLSLAAGTGAQLAGTAVTAALQAMVDGGEQSVLVRRLDTGNQTIQAIGRLVVEFDLTSPPN